MSEQYKAENQRCRVNDAQPGEAVVVLEGVRKRYKLKSKWIDALAGVDLSVSRGVIQGIIGFSGAGKTTLLRCISRLEQPDEGRVLVAGKDLAHLKSRALREARKQIGVVFQQFHLLRSHTVAANIGLPLKLAGRPRAEIAARVQELLQWFGLADKAEQYPAQLSGGQRQRVAIARALAIHPAVLLTDEPTSALDRETTASVLELLQRIRNEFGVTILIITHEIDAVRAICDRVAVLEDGRIVEEGEVAKVLSQPESSASKRLLGISPDEAKVPQFEPVALKGTPIVGGELCTN
jgi:D-methionine transport system ATP-binding protein